MDSILKFRMRRKERLDKRFPVVRDVICTYRRNREKRLDSKSHGNTKLPFGLCKKEGIEIKPEWTPKDAWDALKGKGYSPEEEYKKLKNNGEKHEIENGNEKKEYNKINNINVKDIKLIKDKKGIVRISGIDIYGNTVLIDSFNDFEKAKTKLEENGIYEYEVGKGTILENNTNEYNGEKFYQCHIYKDKNGKYYVMAMSKKDFKYKNLGDYYETEKEAIDFLKENGFSTYSTYDNKTQVIEVKDFSNLKEPTYGMENVSVVETSRKKYKVFADTKQFGKHHIMFEAKTIDECNRWLNENNVQEKEVKKITLLPNHYVKRNCSAKTLKKFDKRRIEFLCDGSCEADTIISLTDEQRNNYTDMMSDIFKNGAYRMRRSYGSFINIILNGRFKNQFETKTSGGLLDDDERKNIAKLLFGTPKNLNAEEREKYGYIGCDDDIEEVNNRVANTYGGVIFKFKKDAVESNSTYTLHDSIDYGARCAGYCGDNATIEGLGTCSKNELSLDYEKYQEYKNDEITYKDLLDYITNSDFESNKYLEIQYHGELTTDKIESIIFENEDEIRVMFRSKDNETIQKVYDEMKKLSIPIKYMKRGKSYEYYRYEYGDVLDYMKNKYNLVDK